MRRVARMRFRQMQTVQTIRQFRIVRRQQDQAVSLRAQSLAQLAAAFGIARPHDHQAAFRQGLGCGNWVGQTVIVRHERQQARR